MPRILLVEDNEMNRDMLSRRLTRKGYEVIMAIDGGAAIDAACGQRPDLILMDISLPDTDGWEVTRTLRSRDDTAAIRIIALTAHATESDRVRSIEAGCDDFDTKPIDLPRLLGKIEALLYHGGLSGMSGLDAFLVHMRHEFRSPVNAIVGYSQLLLEEEGEESLRPSARRDLERVEEAGRELLRIIGEILDPVDSPASDISQYGVRLRHAMRTPITSVLGYVEILLEELDGSHMADDLRRVHLAASRLVELSDSIERLYLVRTGQQGPGPLPSSPEAARAAAALAVRPEEHSSGAAVLVIDNEEANRALLARRLARQGHRVLLAQSGEEGLAIASSQEVDVILLDILMPGLSGYEVLARLKADEKLRDLPVLMITVLDDPASAIRCLGLGADDYLAKPFDPLLLRARVSSCYARKRARDFELAYLRGVAAVTGAALALEAGTFEPGSLDEVARRADALGNLARLFQRMGVEVAARERRLRQQVEELTIVIDERKRAAQVAEITESDYFRGLQDKMRDIAARRAARERKP